MKDAKGRESPGRIALWAAAGAAAIYLATWTGAFTFYLSFERPLLALEAGRGRGVLQLEPAREPEAAGEAGGQTHEVDGVRLPLPAGRMASLKSENGLYRVKVEDAGVESELTIEVHPAGFLSSLLRGHMEHLGVKAGAVPDDAAALEEIARESLGRYRFRWSETERQEYAARLLCKMTLWEGGAAGRFELARRGSSTAVLAVQARGEAKVIIAGAANTFVVVIPASSPAAWKRSAGNWCR